MTTQQKTVYFFIGTEAELIKIFTIIDDLIKRGVNVKIISSGQNDISASPILKEINGGKVDLTVTKEKIKQTPVALLFWFLRTYMKAAKALKVEFSTIDKSKSLLVVHGDTISTIMGARIAKKLGLKVAHVEAGLRSHNYFSPFPEEIDRIITSWYTDIHFPPCEEGVHNLRNKQGKVINTYTNPVYDSYIYSQKIPLKNTTVKNILKTKYFLFVVHRNENLANETLMRELINRVVKTANNDLQCAFILHGPTEFTLNKLGLFKKLSENKNIHPIPRLEYFDFMKLAEKATFVITDGGSNQQEFYFMGTPCILMRSATEQPEGLGKNIVLSKNNLEVLDDFILNYDKYRRKPYVPKHEPTEIITKAMLDEIR